MGSTTKKTTKPNPGARLNPRERQRIAEKNKRRRIRRKRFVIFSFSFIIIAIIAATVWGFLTLFKVKDYIVEGNKTYSADQIFEISGLEKGKNLFFSKINTAEEQLEFKLPYIGNAEILRVMPGTLKFKITETQKACAMKYGSGFLYFNSDGKILEQKAGKITDGLPLLQCTKPINIEPGKTVEFTSVKDGPDSPEILKIYKELLAAIKTSKIRNITVLDMSDPEDIALVYQGRITLIIGIPSKLESRLMFAARVLVSEDKISKKQKGTIDLTDLKKAYFKPATVE